MLLAAHGLTKLYGAGPMAVTALREVDFELAAGEIVALVGPSGSGKSTLLGILGGLDVPTSGQYRLDGVDVGGLGRRDMAELRKSKIGFVFQDHGLIAHLTILQNVALPLVYLGLPVAERERIARSALARVRIPELADRVPGQASLGQRQRAAVARALVAEPRILLADEPTGSLDEEATAAVLDIFVTAARDGTGVIIATHNLDLAAAADRKVTIRNGTIVDCEERRRWV